MQSIITKMENQEIRIQLTDEDYKIVKKIYASSDSEYIQLNDEIKEFVAKSMMAEIIFEEYINTHAFDNSGEYHVTSFGRKLYDLYDLIFFSEVVE